MIQCTLKACTLKVGCCALIGGIEEYMKPFVVEYPEVLPGLLRMTEEKFAAEVRLLAAAKLFELGKLSSGKAAAKAGLGRVAFLHKLGGLWLLCHQFA